MAEATEDNPVDNNNDELSEEEYAYSDVEEQDSDSEYSDDGYSSADSDPDFYHHYQFRISLIKRRRLCELKNLFKVNDFLLQKAHLSPSSSPALGSIFFDYCSKAETRIAGPWRSDEYSEPIKMPRQLRMIKELYSWQQEVIDRSLYCWDSRTHPLIGFIYQ